MFRVIESDTADELWRGAARWFLPNGGATPQAGRGGDTSEVLRAALSIKNPRQRWIGSRSPALNPAFAIAEVIWIMRGREDARFLNFFNRALPRFAGNGLNYHGAYGFRLRKHFGVDQLERAYSTLKTDPSSRQVVLQIWDGAKDLPRQAVAVADDIPCNVVAFLKVRDGKLEWTQVMRSNDLFRGLPHNIVQFSTLQEVVAGWLGLEPSSYHHFSDSLHLYANDGDVEARIVPVNVPLNQDSLALPKGKSDAVFASLSDFVDNLISAGASAQSSMSELLRLELPQSFMNLASILAADALRRRGSRDLMENALACCTNNCLRFMYHNYALRMRNHL